MQPMRALALALVIAVPAVSFAQQKVELSPCYDQAVSQKLLAPEATPTPLLHRWQFWTVSAASLAVIAGIIAAVAYAAAPHNNGPLHQSDFRCGTMCAGWLNQPQS